MLTSMEGEVTAGLLNTVPINPEKIVFLGDTPFFHQTFSLFFPNCQQVSDYNHAKKILAGMDPLPDLIIIDIPLQHLELVGFRVWLRNYPYHKIPVIYNQTALNSNEIKQLFSQKLVEDVVSLETHYGKLPYKIRFIQKLNSVNAECGEKKSTPKEYHFLNVQDKFSINERLLDITFSACVLIFTLPLIILIAIAIKCESKGPVLYCSKRAGKGFKIFKFFKFRTMVLDAENQIKELESLNQYENQANLPAFFKLANDPRVTKVGSFLRKTSLDELPQLLNVLKGDMSMVGNRPLPLYEASTLTTNEWAERFMAPAGITGLWQISKRGKAEMSNEERVLIDINYARTRSFKKDLVILLQTPSAMIQTTNV